MLLDISTACVAAGEGRHFCTPDESHQYSNSILESISCTKLGLKPANARYGPVARRASAQGQRGKVPKLSRHVRGGWAWWAAAARWSASVLAAPPPPEQAVISQHGRGKTSLPSSRSSPVVPGLEVSIFSQMRVGLPKFSHPDTGGWDPRAQSWTEVV